MCDFDFSVDDLVDCSDDEPRSRVGERLHVLHESIFGCIGPALVANEWSCFPQERGERRRPATVDRHALKWKPYQERLPTAAEMRSWSLQCPGENVTVITGPVSGNLFALDVDVNDPTLSNAVRACAVEHLGDTPFLRFGRVPRVIMLYRHLPGEVMRKKSYRFGEYRDDGSWGASDHALEILANGSPFTAYGIHHKTGDYFKWGDAQPLTTSPDALPLVTLAQLESFLAAVQEVRRFFSGRTVSSSGDVGDLEAAAAVPYDSTKHGPVPSVERAGQWVVEDGVVTDGRHAYLLDYCRRLVCANEMAFDTARDPDAELDEARDSLVAHAREHVKTLVRDDGKRSRQALTEELNGILKATVHKFNLREGGKRLLAPIRTHRGADGRVVEPVGLTMAFPRDAALSWLGDRSAASGLVATYEDPAVRKPRLDVLGVDAPTEAKAAARALGGARTEMLMRVQACNAEGVGAWVGDVTAVGPADEDGKRPLPPWRVHLHLGPTGAGKSTATVDGIAAMLKTEKAAGKPYAGPIVFTPPSHANISELVTKGRGHGMRMHTDDEVEADDCEGMDLQELADHATALGLNAVHLKSKVLAGCHKEATVTALMAAGLATSGLCRAKRLDAGGFPVRDDQGQEVEDFCEHYLDASCGHRQQLLSLETADVVFCAHAHLTNRIPEALKAARGLVIDESIVHQLLATGQVAISTLFLLRPCPPLTKAEVDLLRTRHGGRSLDDATVGAHMMGLMDDRRDAADLVARAHAERLDVTDLFIRTPDALKWALTAKRICGAALAMSRRVHPGITPHGIDDLAKRAKHFEAEIEWRFWDTLLEGAERHVREGDPRAASDDPLPIDTRLQAVTDFVGKGKAEVAFPAMRVSWRRPPNWQGLPTLLLDATGDEQITKLLYPRADVFTYEPEGVLPNLRVVLVGDRSYSPSMLYPPGDAPKAKVEAARTIRAEVRRLLAMLAGVHGHGQVLLTAPIKARLRMERERGWIPGNAVPSHFGALRGQDWAKGFLASICVGRSEQPIRVVDGLVAALTWDSEAPEHPYDRLGTGRDADGAVLYRPRLERVVRMRTGHDVRMAVPQMPTDMGRRVEAMWREAEIAQMVGRLRGIHRPEAATVVLMCDCPPDGLIVDDVLTLREALGDHDRAWEVAGTVGGVMVPGLTDRRIGHRQITKATHEGLKREEVVRFVARYRHWPAMRVVSWTDAEGTLHEGVMPAWHRDVRAALRGVGATDEVLDLLDVPEDRVEPVPMVAREPDHVSLAAAEARLLADAHYAIWQVSHLLGKTETEWARRRRFEASYDTSMYPVLPPEDDDAPPTAPGAGDMELDGMAC